LRGCGEGQVLKSASKRLVHLAPERIEAADVPHRVDDNRDAVLPDLKSPGLRVANAWRA
jgi:hypothetical protein